MAKIGVFDSGIGGQSVAKAISTALPGDEVLFVNDNKNVPYGTKTEQQIYDLALPLLQKLVIDGCKIIVVACNSVSTAILPRLQANLSIPLIGVEPMVKDASEKTKTGIIAVCATPLTLKSERYQSLCAEYAEKMVLIEPDCSEWAFMIEHDMIDRSRIKLVIDDVLEQSADVIVLGCTHYHWIEKLIKSIAKGRALVLQPEEQIVGKVKQALTQLV